MKNSSTPKLANKRPASSPTKTRHAYTIRTLADVRKHDTIFVPNSSVEEAVEIWRWLSGHRKDFPAYKDGSILINSIDEAAWCPARDYRAEFCPHESICIVREAV